MSEKNYGFIRLDPPTQSDIKTRDKLREIVVLTYFLKVESPFHVGSGFVRKNEAGVVAKDIARDETGTPIIPGSTIKGCIEANFRYIVKGACGTDRCRPKDRIFPLCNLFGAMSLGSRIHFKDLKLTLLPSQKEQGLTPEKLTEIIQIPWLTTPKKQQRNPEAVDSEYSPVRLTTPKKQQRYFVKYYYNIDFDKTNIGPLPIWITKTGASFQGQIRIENPTYDELQMIIYTLFYRTKGLQIGLGKNLGMGVLKTQFVQIEKFNPINPKTPTEEKRIKPTEFKDFIKNWDLFNQDAIREINETQGNPLRTGGS